MMWGILHYAKIIKKHELNKSSPDGSINLLKWSFPMNKKQLKSILVTLALPTLITVDAVAHERGGVGHVVDVQPIYETRVVQHQVAETKCHSENQMDRKRVHDALFGSLVGAAIGNELSNAPGFGTLGAAVGLALSESQHRSAEKCETVWRPERRRVTTLAYYKVSVAHRGRVLHFNSEQPYQVGEHIHFTH